MIYAALAIYLMATYLDYDTTRLGLREGFRERNKLTNWFLKEFGPERGLLFKTLAWDLAYAALIFAGIAFVPFFQGTEGYYYGLFLLLIGALGQFVVANGNAKLLGYSGLLAFVRKQL